MLKITVNRQQLFSVIHPKGQKKKKNEQQGQQHWSWGLFVALGELERNKRVNRRSIIKYASQRDIGYSRTQVATLCYPLNSFSWSNNKRSLVHHCSWLDLSKLHFLQTQSWHFPFFYIKGYSNLHFILDSNFKLKYVTYLKCSHLNVSLNLVVPITRNFISFFK